MSDQKRWVEKYAEAGPMERLALLGAAAMRASANAVDTVTERASRTFSEARVAFQKELDPNITDAHILEERTRLPDEKD